MSSQSIEKKPVENSEEVYKKREKIYPREVHGIFAKMRVLGVLALLGPYYLVPWLSWGGQQSVLFDLPGRKFHIFGLTFWPQDFFYLAVLLIIAALALFFFTALAGRLWCGFACPQTVWTEAFLWIERKVEGNRNKQIKLDKSDWGSSKAVKKFTKHGIWILFSLWTGLTFAGYFSPIRELTYSFVTFGTGPWETFWIIFYGGATYGNAGWMREQVCIYMCPYARFQSAMFDKDTLIISYDEKRGEPRGRRKKTVDPAEAGLGDCVGCQQCVQVCPTGIDIRDGLQYQCIGCAACIDACDTVMEKMGYDKGLIRYTTEHQLEGHKTNMLRPRVVFYALLLLTLVGGLGYSIFTRVPLELDIIRDRNALYRETGDGMIQNVYILKVINMDDQTHQYNITATGLEGLQLHGVDNVSVASGNVGDLVVQIEVDPENIPAVSNVVNFHISAVGKPELEQQETARFLGPLR